MATAMDAVQACNNCVSPRRLARALCGDDAPDGQLSRRCLLRQAHFPIWFGAMASAGSPAFLVLFVLETMSRATVVAVLPLLALELLGDAQAVSILYFLVGTAGLMGSLAVPWLVGLVKRRWTFTLGLACVVASAPLLASQTMAGLVVGLTFQLFGSATASICLNLYVLDHIPRKAFGRFEPLRMLFVGAGWMIGPVLGIALGKYVAPWLPFAVAAGFALAQLGYFWFLRLTENPVLAGVTAPATNPLRFVRRYFAQPRLALAWILAVGRGGWWGMFFVYVPIYAVTVGLGEEAGALIISAGSASMFLVVFWGWLGRRYGLRRLLIWGYLVNAILTLAAGVTAELPWLGVSFIVAAAIAASAIDGAGNLPFMRAVRPRERAEMTTVFSTYRDMSRLAMPGAFSLVLQVFALPAVFVTSALTMAVLAHYSRYIPRRL